MKYEEVVQYIKNEGLVGCEHNDSGFTYFIKDIEDDYAQAHIIINEVELPFRSLTTGLQKNVDDNSYLICTGKGCGEATIRFKDIDYIKLNLKNEGVIKG